MATGVSQGADTARGSLIALFPSVMTRSRTPGNMKHQGLINNIKRLVAIFAATALTLVAFHYARFAAHILYDDYQEACQPSYEEALAKARSDFAENPISVERRLTLIHYLSLASEKPEVKEEVVGILKDGIRLSPDSEELQSRLKDFSDK